MQVFMVVRHHQIDFASGALVFPGGKVDEQDFDDALLPFINAPHSDLAMRAIQVSAIREAFEECGVLLARPVGSDDLVSGDVLKTLDVCREPLHSGELPLLKFLQDNQLVLACDLLTHFSHWITPEMMPKRFDTHFYLAVAPSDHLAIHDGYESVDSVWITPPDAISQAKSGERTIIFPTLCNIEKLAHSKTVEDALAAANADTIQPILPWMERRDDGGYVCIPTDQGYPTTEQKVPDRSG